MVQNYKYKYVDENGDMIVNLTLTKKILKLKLMENFEENIWIITFGFKLIKKIGF